MNLKKYCEDNSQLCLINGHKWFYSVDSWVRIHTHWSYTIIEELKDES